MWKTNQKLIPLAKIHAKGARYLLTHTRDAINRAAYFRRNGDAHSTFRLAGMADALRVETEQLRAQLDAKSKDLPQAQVLQSQITENERSLEMYVHKLNRELHMDSSVPIDLVIGSLYLTSHYGLLDQARFEELYRERLLEKVNYASLRGLSDLSTTLSELGYSREDRMSKQVNDMLADRFKQVDQV